MRLILGRRDVMHKDYAVHANVSVPHVGEHLQPFRLQGCGPVIFVEEWVGEIAAQQRLLLVPGKAYVIAEPLPVGLSLDELDRRRFRLLVGDRLAASLLGTSYALTQLVVWMLFR